MKLKAREDCERRKKIRKPHLMIAGGETESQPRLNYKLTRAALHHRVIHYRSA